VKLRLKVMPMDILTSDNEPIECYSFECESKQFRNVLEMVQGFIIDAAFGVTGIVTPKSVAAAAPRKRPEEGFLLLDFVEMEVEEPGPVTIDKGYP